ncbi:hypothetical protein BC567DRAFT_46436 [Phyllosticta citribraziliensis]
MANVGICLAGTDIVFSHTPFLLLLLYYPLTFFSIADGAFRVLIGRGYLLLRCKEAYGSVMFSFTLNSPLHPTAFLHAVPHFSPSFILHTIRTTKQRWTETEIGVACRVSSTKKRHKNNKKKNTKQSQIKRMIHRASY